MDAPDDLDFLAAQAEAEAEEEEQPPAEFNLPAPVKPQLQTTLPFAQQLPAQYLPALNEAQKSAVMAAPAGGLQILAGPGSGKTKVLTARVAYLAQHYKLSPEDMVVVTFTNKAANEMKSRLKLLVGSAVVERLMMGTFHSVCVRYLRKYGKLVGLSPSFTVADRDDCMAIIKRAIQSTPVDVIGLGTDALDRLRKGFKPNTAGDIISQCKSRNITHEAYVQQETRKDGIGDEYRERVRMYAEVFEKYNAELRAGNALDFDDLLLFGLDLVEKHPHVVGKVKTVLIDEFQDTSVIQYKFVKCLAKASASLTIVGDPDQSIYGWRNAEVENLERMLSDFEPVKQIFLEENYRSTGAILGAALAVVKQDTKRIDKSLKATHTSGSSVVLHCAPNAYEEAAYIAAQIKHLIAHTGGQIDFGDCAILLRYGALSRNIEVALQKAGIPSRMSGGHKFFDRPEVKDVLSYLQLVENPSYTAAFLRVVNVPTRSIGDKTAKAILLAAQKYKLSPFDIAVKLANRSQVVTGITEPQRKGLREFVTAVRDLRNSADKGTSVSDLIDELVRKVRYQAHLERTHGPDAKDRWDNLEELKAYAMVVAAENPEGVPDAALVDDADVEMDEVHVGGVRDEDDEIEEFDGADDSGFEEIIMPPNSQPANEVASPLRTFLAVSMLATDSETEESKNDASARKVTISTCHSSKGLEWPVVFVPACENGIYPFYRSSEPEQIDEERRLLYVAITRAQAFCTLSYAHNRMAGSETKETDVSSFLKGVSERYKTLFVAKLQKISPTTRLEVSKIIGRPPVTEAAVATAIALHTATLPAEPPTYSYTAAPTGSQESQGGGFSTGRYSGSSFQGAGQKWNNRPIGVGPAPVPTGAGFQSALSTYRAAPVTVAPVAGPSLQASTSRGPPNDQPKLSFGQGAARPAGSTTKNGLRRLASTERVLSFSQPAARRSLGSTSSSDLSQPLSQPTDSQLATHPTPATLPSFPTPPPLPEAYHAPPPPARLQPPPLLKPASTAFKAPRPLAAADRILSFSRPRAVPVASTSNHTIPLPTVSSSTPSGPLVMPETRASRIDDAILLNPVARLTTTPDLLASFQSNETAAMSQLRNLGSPKEKGKENGIVIDLTSDGLSSDGVEVLERVGEVVGSGRPRRGAAKRAMERFPKKPLPGKKARKST